MKMNFFLTVINLLILSFGNICAQELEHHAHEHSRNEIGFSGGVLYAIGHKEWGSGLHVHYFRTLKPHSKWSLPVLCIFMGHPLKPL